MDILKEANEMQEQLVEWRHYLHKNPEIGMDLPVTAAFIKEKLSEMGIVPEEICQSGFKVVLGKKEGKTFLIRGDSDALPIPEETDEPFKSECSNMHACGHDLHTAMLLGAAKLLKKHEDKINGKVVLMFQPGEEVMAGAKEMVANGILENPKVDAGMMIHVFTSFPVDDGKLLCLPKGAATASIDKFEINIQGKGCHGAMPDMGIDPINVMSHIHIALQSINAREIPPSETFVLTVGKAEAGSAANIVPDKALMMGTIRTFNPEVRAFAKKRLEDIVKSVAETFRATATVDFSNSCGSVINDSDVLDFFVESATKLLGESDVISPDRLLAEAGVGRLAGSEDFAFVAEKIPAIIIGLCAGNSKKGYIYPQHHPKSKFVDSVLSRGTAVYANSALDWLEKNNK